MTSRQKKSFTEGSVLRILENVPRNVAIGAIIKAEQSLRIRPPDELEKLTDSLVDAFFNKWPEKLVDFIFRLFPKFKQNLSLFLALMFGKYLELLPSEVLQIDYESAEEPIVEIITQDEYDELKEERDDWRDKYNNLSTAWNQDVKSLREQVRGVYVHARSVVVKIKDHDDNTYQFNKGIYDSFKELQKAVGKVTYTVDPLPYWRLDKIEWGE